MSSSLVIPSMFVMLLVLLSSSLSLSSPTFSSKVTQEVLNDICSGTRNASYCLEALKSDPKTATANITGLCQISIDLARDNAAATYNMLRILAQMKVDPELKARYAACYKNYNDAIGFLNQATEKLNAGNPTGVNIAASNIPLQVSYCENNFRGPPADPSSLPTRNQNLMDLSVIIVIVADQLMKNMLP